MSHAHNIYSLLASRSSILWSLSIRLPTCSRLAFLRLRIVGKQSTTFVSSPLSAALFQLQSTWRAIATGGTFSGWLASSIGWQNTATSFSGLSREKEKGYLDADVIRHGQQEAAAASALCSLLACHTLSPSPQPDGRATL